jgi:hypothetical protein
MQWEHALYSYTCGDASNSETRCRTFAILQSNHYALEDLNSFSFAFPYPEVHPDGIARAEFWNPWVGVFFK